MTSNSDIITIEIKPIKKSTKLDQTGIQFTY